LHRKQLPILSADAVESSILQFDLCSSGHCAKPVPGVSFAGTGQRYQFPGLIQRHFCMLRHTSVLQAKFSSADVAAIANLLLGKPQRAAIMRQTKNIKASFA